MALKCACGLLAVARCSGCDQPKCHSHMTHTYGPTALRNLCSVCAPQADAQNTVERQRIDVRLLLQERNREAAVQDAVRRLVEAGSPGAVAHVHVTRRRLRPSRTVDQGIAGFPIGVIRYRYLEPTPSGEDAIMTDEAEALVLTDGRIVLVGGEQVTDVDQGVVRDRIHDHARRHGVPVAP